MAAKDTSSFVGKGRGVVSSAVARKAQTAGSARAVFENRRSPGSA